jgi:hypothetical protein
MSNNNAASVTITHVLMLDSLWLRQFMPFSKPSIFFDPAAICESIRLENSSCNRLHIS